MTFTLSKSTGLAAPRTILALAVTLLMGAPVAALSGAGPLASPTSPIAGEVSGRSSLSTQQISSVPTAISGNTPSYSVSFVETGLPSGTSWSAMLNGTTHTSTTATISFTEPNGTYQWNLTPIAGYNTSAYSGFLTVLGGNVTRAVLWSRVTDYEVTFTESGLPSGAQWWVNVTGGSSTSSSTTALSFLEPNGTYNYSVATADKAYATAGGSFTVFAANLSQAVTFLWSSGGQYEISFREKGLASGLSWSLTLNNTYKSSTTPFLNFTEPNGSYSYVVWTPQGYNATPASGNMSVSGTPLSIPISFSSFSPGKYPVTFGETGLKNGTRWGVTIGASTQSQNGSTIVVFEPNGSYSYTIVIPAGYRASTQGGIYTVSGIPLYFPLSFTAVPTNQMNYTVSFAEFGLPTGTSWSVTFAGTALSSKGSTIPFSKPNGTWNFTVPAVGGYVPTPSHGNVTVNGTSPLVRIYFTPPATTLFFVVFTENGLPAGTNWSVTLNSSTAFSTQASITFHEPNGTYAYTVGAVSGYTLSTPASTNVPVAGQGVSLNVSFQAKEPPPPSGPSTGLFGLPGVEGYLVLAAIVVAALGAAAAALWMRKRKAPSVPPAAEPTPPQPPST